MIPDNEETPMALSVCRPCATAFAVGLAQCPHCGSGDYYEQGADEAPARPADTAPDSDPEPAPPAPTTEDGEQPSPGTSSQTLPAKPPTTETKNDPRGRKRARTTASPSTKAPTGSSAPSTDGGPAS